MLNQKNNKVPCIPNFDNLLDIQNEDLQKLYVYRIGLMQIYTGY